MEYRGWAFFIKSLELAFISKSNISDIMEYLKKLRTPIECLQERMQKVEVNVQEMRTVLGIWDRLPLFERKESKKDTVFCLDERADRIFRRYADIEKAATRIQA